mmetsp:Transcript_24540/g.68865  ORF Transcript_24540/g.68865 Transcript_24540/m.68865 type:complete len:652 (-) Transcript_24540:469-2424(-)
MATKATTDGAEPRPEELVIRQEEDAQVGDTVPCRPQNQSAQSVDDALVSHTTENIGLETDSTGSGSNSTEREDLQLEDVQGALDKALNAAEVAQLLAHSAVEATKRLEAGTACAAESESMQQEIRLAQDRADDLIARMTQLTTLADEEAVLRRSSRASLRSNTSMEDEHAIDHKDSTTEIHGEATNHGQATYHGEDTDALGDEIVLQASQDAPQSISDGGALSVGSIWPNDENRVIELGGEVDAAQATQTNDLGENELSGEHKVTERRAASQTTHRELGAPGAANEDLLNSTLGSSALDMESQGQMQSSDAEAKEAIYRQLLAEAERAVRLHTPAHVAGQKRDGHARRTIDKSRTGHGDITPHGWADLYAHPLSAGFDGSFNRKSRPVTASRSATERPRSTKSLSIHAADCSPESVQKVRRKKMDQHVLHQRLTPPRPREDMVFATRGAADNKLGNRDQFRSRKTFARPSSAAPRLTAEVFAAANRREGGFARPTATSRSRDLATARLYLLAHTGKRGSIPSSTSISAAQPHHTQSVMATNLNASSVWGDGGCRSTESSPMPISRNDGTAASSADGLGGHSKNGASPLSKVSSAKALSNCDGMHLPATSQNPSHVTVQRHSPSPNDGRRDPRSLATFAGDRRPDYLQDWRA